MRGLREQPARVLANRPLEGAREVFKRERAGSAQRPHRPKAEPSTAPALGKHGPDLPGLHCYCPMKGKAVKGVCRHAGAPHRLSNARVVPLGLGLSYGLMGGEELKGAVSTLQQPREQGTLAERRGEQRGGWPSPLCPSSLRAARRSKGPVFP